MTEFSSLRQQAGLSVSEAAERLGYTEREAYRWESGEVKPRRAVLTFCAHSGRPAVTRQRPAGFHLHRPFAGIGGLRRGFDAIGGRCVFTCEWDRYSQKTYLANFPTTRTRLPATSRRWTRRTYPRTTFCLPAFPASPFPSPASRRRTRSTVHTVSPAKHRDAVFRRCAHHQASSAEGVSPRERQEPRKPRSRAHFQGHPRRSDERTEATTSIFA